MRYGFVAAAVVMASLLTASAARAEDVPEAVDHAHDVIVSRAEKLLHWAYPSAKCVVDGPSGKWGQLGDGYYIDEKIHYTDSDGDLQCFTLRFVVNADGKFTRIVERDRTSFWPTFSTANFFVALVKEQAKSAINDAHMQDQESPQWAVNVMKLNGVSDILVELLNAHLL